MVVRDLGSRVNRCMNTFVYLVCKDQVRPILMPVLSWFGAGGVGFVWFGLVSGGGGRVWVLLVFGVFFVMHDIQEASGAQNE